MLNASSSRLATLVLFAGLLVLHAEGPEAGAAEPPAFLFSFGSEGGGDGQFFWGTFIGSPQTANLAVEGFDRDLFVVDCTLPFGGMPGSRVQKFDPDGNFILKFGFPGLGDGGLSGGGPCYVTVDRDGDVYVADEGHREIEVFDNDGSWVHKWGGHGFGPDQFIGIQGITTDGNGDVYVLNTVPGQIKKFDRNGTPLGPLALTGPGESASSLLALGSDGGDRIYAAFILRVTGVFEGGAVRTYDPSGAILSTILFEDPPFAVHGVTGDAAGHIYVTEGFGKHRVSQFAADGTLLAQWGMNGSGPGEFDNPAGVAINDAGRLYVADTGNKRVQVFQFDTPEDRIEDLIEDVQALGLRGKGGQAQLNAALNALSQDPPDVQAAIVALQDFINFVNAQSGKKIPVQEAAELIAAAQAIIDELSQ